MCGGDGGAWDGGQRAKRASEKKVCLFFWRYVECPFTSNEEEIDNDKNNESGVTLFFGVGLTMEDDE